MAARKKSIRELATERRRRLLATKTGPFKTSPGKPARPASVRAKRDISRMRHKQHLDKIFGVK